MQAQIDREFGTIITRLLQKENLSRLEARDAFYRILKDEITDMQQGAFLAALTAKGETEEEVAGSWEAIYELDTEKVAIEDQVPLVENSGTGMDSFKTFNISTAASIIAAAGGVKMARHGARAITSVCGTVDIAEALGVDVECSVDIVAASIQNTGIGLFNGMSPQIHPRALGRILSQIFFGSTLNIAASLANPALPKRAVRGVYSKEIILPVVKVMKAIGYERALVLHGSIEDSTKGMDEASVCGKTYCVELREDEEIREFTFQPGDYGMDTHDASGLSPLRDIQDEAKKFVSLIQGKQNGARFQSSVLNAGLIYYIAEKADSIQTGIEKAVAALKSGLAFETLKSWVMAQNRDPENGSKKLERLI